MNKPALSSTSLSSKSKDTTKKPFIEIFYPELSKCIINSLRRKGCFVISYFDLQGEKRILATSQKINRHNVVQKDGTARFISIIVEGVNSKNQHTYKNRIIDSGGAFITVSSLPEFYRKFEEVCHD